MESEEAISHVLSSTRYWSRMDTDPFAYPQLDLEHAFNAACWHVMDSHGYDLSVEEIKIVKKRLGLEI